MSRNEIIRSGSTARNPSERGMNVPSGAPSNHSQTMSPGPTGLPKSNPQALADRVRGGPDASQGDALGADRRAR
jgi:hypothetical protein